MKIYLLIICFFISNIAYATPQWTDILIYNDKEYPLLQFPLEGYFYQNPSKRPNVMTLSSTWRGYTALFEIKDNKFYVINISNFDPENHLNWWNGMLIMPDGELMLSVSEIIESSVSLYEIFKYYDFYKFIEIKNGELINEYRLNNCQYRSYDEIIQYLFSKTKAYLEIYPWKKNENDKNVYENEILPNEIIEYIKYNYGTNLCFFDFIPIIYYNELLSIESIEEYVKNYRKIKLDLKLIMIIIISIIGIVVISKMVKKRKNTTSLNKR
jgi:hypothetical protein